MFNLALLYSFALVLCIIPGGFAGPACTRKYYQSANCVQKCSSRWGYPGLIMGSSPWGVVMKPLDDNAEETWKSAIAEACGMASSSSSSTSTNTSNSKSKDTTTQDSGLTGAANDPYIEETIIEDGSTMDSTATFKTAGATSTTALKNTKPTPPPGNLLPTSTTVKPKAAPKPTPPPTNNGNTTTTPQGGDIGLYLKAHNDFRAQHGAKALVWNDKLATQAQNWAKGCQFMHSGGPSGENIAAGTGDGYGIASAIKSWTDEAPQYNANSPSPSHFTQVVWKNTKQLGCALQICDGIFEPKFGKAKYVVCEYDPPGNFNNDFARNVQV